MARDLPDRTEAEGIEALAWDAMYAAAPPPFAAATGLASRSFGAMTAYAIKAAPTIQFNRAQRAGPEKPSADDLAASADWMRGNASPAWTLQLPEDDDRPARLGLRPSGSWTKFGRSLTDLPEAGSRLDLRVVGPDRASDFGSVVAAAFGAPPPFAAWIASLVGLPGWTVYVAYEGETPGAAAALAVSGEVAWLGMGCALPEFRRQGAQSALLARRLGDARGQGARVAVTETGTPPPGGIADHPSYRNITRAGFQPLYLRTNWRPEAG
ncbi:hypothetical protein Rumeso_00144 [Rubellimicrobium mesophilum DSM 19309]|uniref:N-acetyltransferase domain-containing protein n=1 Tax=Rubellimicrobium mesophilum DSM 19309 TaxID=442562 RepID=A0A017HVF7_9RHOB|nr:GNAT family N-acetyltransferase [Rubellimicrobium mesophilum]EYD78315.1 hypothetical protein Rumeso_00144 [Rubellimicrobium mesophilum DSM 19309]